jgi:hypothetical protein
MDKAMAEDRVLNRAVVIKDITEKLILADDTMLHDIITDLERKPATTIGTARDIVVIIRPGLDGYDITMVQAIEKVIDDALNHMGFGRNTSEKRGHKVEFAYGQYCKAIRS